MERARAIYSIVDKVFTSLAIDCPHLAVIVLVTMGKFHQDDGVDTFMRAKQIDSSGESTFTGMPVEHHMVKHYEPCSEILEPEKFGSARPVK